MTSSVQDLCMVEINSFELTPKRLLPAVAKPALVPTTHTQICSFLRGAIAKGVLALETDSAVSNHSSARAVRGDSSSYAARNACLLYTSPSPRD